MRYCILPTTIDSTDEKGLPCKINICPDMAKKSVDGTQFLIHEERMPAEYKKYVIKAVDLEGTTTLNSTIAKSMVLATKARAWMETSAWKAVDVAKEIDSGIGAVTR